MNKLFNPKTRNTFNLLSLAVLAISLPLGVFLTLKPFRIQKMAAENEALLFLFPDSQTFPVNSRFTLKLFLDVPEETKLVVAGSVLTFDPKLLQVKDVRGGGGFSNQIRLDFDNNRGEITIRQGVGGGEPAIGGRVEFAQIDLVGVKKTQEARITFNKSLSSAVSSASEYLSVEAKSGVYQFR